MDRQRFDELTRVLGTTTSRRQVLKGLAGATLGGLLTQFKGGTAVAAPKPDESKKCRPEGKKSKDPAQCCSQTSIGDVCCGEEKGSCAESGCCGGATTNICYNGTCVECLPEGAQAIASDPGTCCSQFTSGGDVCCGVEDGSCATSDCCDGTSATPFCVNGTCVKCLPEGSPSFDSGLCCSQATAGDVCCGEENGSCAESGCCGGATTPTCHNGTCVDCLPEGAQAIGSDPNTCCSKGVGFGTDTCCGVDHGSCAQSGCCGSTTTTTPLCYNGTCVECLPEGEPAEFAEQCCTLARHDGVCIDCLPEGAFAEVPIECCSETIEFLVCCGEGGGSCVESGCCTSDFTCCNGNCVPICPPPMTHNPDTCLCEVPCSELNAACTPDTECCSGACCNGVCHADCPTGETLNPGTCVCQPTDDVDVCTGADNTFDPACVNDDGSFTRRCCNGVCCVPGDVCRDGVCVGGICSNPDGTEVICPSETRCICRPPSSSTPNPDGCVCCPVCPKGSPNSAMVDCQGGCGSCCSGCVRQSDGSFQCGA